MSLLHKHPSFGTRKVSPPQPTCMSDEQKASYLSDLRTNRPTRPSGSRPLPSKPSPLYAEHKQNASFQSNSSSSFEQKEGVVTNDGVKSAGMIHSTSMKSVNNQKGRPIAQAPASVSPTRTGGILSAPQTYHESAERKLEKQEAYTIRKALAKIDLEGEETRLHSAAQMEAADLVWKHRNPKLAEHEKTSAYRNPDLVKKRYVLQNRGSTLDKYKRTESEDTIFLEDKVEPLKLAKRGSQNSNVVDDNATKPQSTRRKSSGTRQVSNGSSKGLFRNPVDQIFEEPDEVETSLQEESKDQQALQSRTRNSLPRGSRPLPGKPHTVPTLDKERLNRFEIYKNPPSQSRNAEYAMNDSNSRSQTPEQQVIETPKGRAMEIRSDEIRAATSMKRKDRSPKLPTPTAVSDKPGRPIVSFDPTWRRDSTSGRGSLDMERPSSRPKPPLPATTVSAPAIPTINLPDNAAEPVGVIPLQHDLPQINLPSEPSSIPTINLPEDNLVESSSVVPTINLTSTEVPVRPLPEINIQTQPQSTTRPLPVHTQSSPPKLPPAGHARGPASRLPWLSRSPANLTLSGSRTAAVTCTACELPISGRIVTASGSANSSIKALFHPECFNCFHCSTALECISFYPEPESALLERLSLTHDSNEEGDTLQQHQPRASDLRFYCHLDFHELFSPKCASCHTPIEGAVILAAGKAWHEGHFFCGECGDPFSSTSPFVESKGYAYCVSCHTKRTSARCRGCKKQILDELSVEALGGKWHEECFVCFECEGDFGNEGRFFVREIEIDLTEKEKRKGADYKKTEEVAVCERCEGRRLKSWNISSYL